MFQDRYDAARQLAARLHKYKDNPDVVILAIPRGALELGYVLAKELHAPLDVVLTKKIGYPGNPEFAIGAVSLESEIIDSGFAQEQVLAPYFEAEIKRLREMLAQRAHQYRGDKPRISLKDKIVIVTDDGLATGKTMAVALDLIRHQNPQKIVVAVPVAPPDALQLVSLAADEVVCLQEESYFPGVGAFYRNFAQVEDDQAIRLLKEANQ